MTGDKAIRDAVRMLGIVAMFSFFPGATGGGGAAFSADDEHDDVDGGDAEADDGDDDDDGVTLIRRWRAKRVRMETELLLHEWCFAAQQQQKGGQVVDSFLRRAVY